MDIRIPRKCLRLAEAELYSYGIVADTIPCAHIRARLSLGSGGQCEALVRQKAVVGSCRCSRPTWHVSGARASIQRPIHICHQRLLCYSTTTSTQHSDARRRVHGRRGYCRFYVAGKPHTGVPWRSASRRIFSIQ